MIKDLGKGEFNMIQAIIKYQTEDAKLKEIEKMLSASEERKKAISAKRYLDGVEENVNKLDARAEALILAYEKAIGEQKTLEEQQSAIVDSLGSIADENQTSYLIKKVDGLIAKIKELSQTASKISDEIQAVLKEYNTIKTTTKVAQEQFKEFGKKYNDLKDSVKEQKEQIESQLEKLKKDVDASLMEKYLKKRENKIFPIVVACRGNVCGGCNFELTMSEINKLKNGEIIEHDCGKLVYMEK